MVTCHRLPIQYPSNTPCLLVAWYRNFCDSLDFAEVWVLSEEDDPWSQARS